MVNFFNRSHDFKFYYISYTLKVPDLVTTRKNWPGKPNKGLINILISGHSYLRILPVPMFSDTFGGTPPVLAHPNGETYDNDYTFVKCMVYT